MRQKKRKTTEKETKHQRRHDSLHWQKGTLVKPNKLQTGLFQPLKASLSFTVIKLLNINLELLTEKYWIKPIPILLNISLTANNHFWYCCPFFASDFQDLCTIPPAMLQNNWFMLLAVHYRVMEHLGSLESTRATLTLLTCSPNFPRAP